MAKYLLYLAVIPFYRQACIDSLLAMSKGELDICAAERQLDQTVRTGIKREQYRGLRVHDVRGKVFWLSGETTSALAAETTILDLNPRSLTSWSLLVVRRIFGKRTLVWGHLHPRAGAEAKSAKVRRLMRRMAHGTVLYGYDGVLAARRELPEQPIWVAPNSLYPADLMMPALLEASESRFLYVGRLVSSKKVELAVEAIAVAKNEGRTYFLDVVGAGPDEERLRAMVDALKISDRVLFHGPVEDPESLKEFYKQATAAVSPGYAGLSLTQSNGFGVPMIVADGEPHAPEIELSRFGGVAWFRSNSAESLASVMVEQVDRAAAQDRASLSARTSQSYSADAMASGLWSALRGKSQRLGKDGWPAS